MAACVETRHHGIDENKPDGGLKRLCVFDIFLTCFEQ